MCFRNHAIKSVLDNFFIQIKIPGIPIKRKRNPETLFQRKLLLCFIRKNQFYVQFLKLNCQGNDLENRITEIKKILCKITNAVKLA